MFDLKWGNRQIRLLVLSQIPLAQQNALWLLFDGKAQDFCYGTQHYKWRDPRQQAVLNQLYELYHLKGAIMPYTIEDFEKEYIESHLHLLPTEKVLSKYSLEERLKGVSPEERLKGLTPEEILKGLPQELIDYLSELKKH